jgi:ATP-dependent exoDNAse (exonuclease V) alpha subunit
LVIARAKPTGTLVVTDERVRAKSLAPSQRVFVRGYAVTSYASQGKTVDTVIFADSGSRAATSAQQWYVSISRGRKRIVVLTPDKAKLRANIQRSGARDLAVQDASGDASQRMAMPGTTERAREAMELARRHQA